MLFRSLNSAEAKTDVKDPDAVNVLVNVDWFVPLVCVIVVACALDNPLVDISPVKVVSVAAGLNDVSVNPI